MDESKAEESLLGIVTKTGVYPGMVDVQRLYERMESWDEGAGDRFDNEVMACVRMLEAFPHIGPVVHRGKVHRVLVFNRHYGLYYVLENRGLILHGLLDLRQDPQSARRRLEASRPIHSTRTPRLEAAHPPPPLQF